MPAAPIIRPLPRSDPAVAAVIAAFRRLTGGRAARDPERRTLVACSGGADSSALALALAWTKAPLVIATVVHDLRKPEHALADRDRVHELAAVLRKPFAQRRIAVRGLPGNAEANARRLRYSALAELAGEHGCPYVAVAHHADDQAETVLMRLVRGGGLRGLGAMADRRELAPGIDLIRPMLGITRADCQRLCGLAGWSWSEDPTNADTSRLRAAVRHKVLPALREISPGVSRRVGWAAALLRDAGGLVAERVMDLRAAGQPCRDGRRGVMFPRALLRAQRPVVLGELLRMVAVELSGGRGADRLGSRPVAAAARAIRADSTEPRVLHWSAVQIHIAARDVRIVAAER